MKKLVWADEHKLGVAKGVDEKIVKGLRDNFEGECKEVGMYLAMARVADRQGYPEIAVVLEKIAHEEAEHAARFQEMLGELVVEDTKANLLQMVNGENGACTYKKQIATWAKENNLDAIHDSVHEMCKDEARHGKALEAILERYFNTSSVLEQQEEDVLVCHCKKVHLSTIKEAISNGATTVEAIMKETKAGTGCGGCKSKLQTILDENL